VPAIGDAQSLGPTAAFGGPAGIRVAVRVVTLLPVLDESVNGRERLAEAAPCGVGDVEALVRVPAVGLLGQADLVGPERRAVRLLTVVLVRAAIADVRPDRDQARAVVAQSGLDRGLDGGEVVAVLDALGMPAVGV